jgi:hypothetical protein
MWDVVRLNISQSQQFAEAVCGSAGSAYPQLASAHLSLPQILFSVMIC